MTQSQGIILVNEDRKQEEKLFLLKQGQRQRVKGKGMVENIGPIHYIRIGMFEGRASRVVEKSDYFSDRA